MKIYYFCPETGFYQGEGFGEAMEQYDTVSGITVQPPPAYGSGQVPKYDTGTQRWILAPLSVRPGDCAHESSG